VHCTKATNKGIPATLTSHPVRCSQSVTSPLIRCSKVSSRDLRSNLNARYSIRESSAPGQCKRLLLQWDHLVDLLLGFYPELGEPTVAVPLRNELDEVIVFLQHDSATGFALHTCIPKPHIKVLTEPQSLIVIARRQLTTPQIDGLFLLLGLRLEALHYEQPADRAQRTQ
jgi:hypothetical protein